MAEAAPALSNPWQDLDLNGDRLEAATTVDSNLLVLAGPGAGKTHLLVAHAVYLARTLPGNVITLTYSRNAAKELTQRISAKLTANEQRRVLATTIHAYAFRLLETYGYRLGLGRPLEILESDRDIDSLARSVGVEYGEMPEASLASRIQRLLRRRALSKEDRAGKTLVGKVLHRMRESGRLSWELCIDLAIELIRTDDIRNAIQHHDRFILLDEAQDCDRSQLLFLWHLIGGPGGNHMLAAMDPDQSLYAFRDANPEEALRWAQALEPKVLELTESHRCPSRIALLARAVLGKSIDPLPPTLQGETRLFFGPGRPEEARFVAKQVGQRMRRGITPERIAILARSGRQLTCVRQELEELRIQFRLNPKVDLSPPEIEILSILQLLQNLEDAVPLEPVSLKALREVLGVDEPTLEDMETRSLRDEIAEPSQLIQDARWRSIFEIWTSSAHPSRLVPDIAAALDLELDRDLPLLHLASQSRTVSALLRKVRRGQRPTLAPSGVLVSTFHGSKGLEFDTVFVIGCEDGAIPHYKSTSEEQLVHERRALYVALTRASREVVITAAKREGPWNRSLSRFLPATRNELWTEIRGLEPWTRHRLAKDPSEP